MPEPKRSPDGPASAPAAKPEPLAAVLAEMRECAHFNRKSLREMPDGYRTTAFWGDKPIVLREAVAERIDNFADRIEAAAERERDEDRQLSAIAESDEAFARCARCDRPERAHGNAAAMRDALNRVGHLAKDLRNITERDTEVRADVNEIVDVCRAALAAPARNCDRFKTEDEAREAYWAYREPLEFNDKPFVAITEWLFATAEGGDHA